VVSIYLRRVQGKNIKQGKGKLTWPNGSIFIGWFENDLKNGKGRYIYAAADFKDKSNGDYYEGDWFNDQPNGFGVFCKRNGFKYTGNFLNGK
jgi:hypothetical protein